MKKLWNILSTVLVALMLLLALTLMGGRLMGWQAFTVVSGSMAPTYQVGDLIYVRSVAPQDIQVGDVITFVMNEQLVVGTHRVVEIEQGDARLYFHTKGDANDTVDAAPVAQENLIGIPTLRVPLLGYLAVYVQNPPGSYIAVAVAAVLLAVLVFPELTGGKKRAAREAAARQAEIQAAVEKALAEERANKG